MQVLKHENSQKFLLCLIGIALAGMILLFFKTESGVGVSPDSVNYISAAKNLAAGKGLTIVSTKGVEAPMTQFAPFFPCILSIFSLLKINIIEGGRFLNIAIFGANIFLAGLFCYYLTRSFLTAILCSFFVLCSVNLMVIHTGILTEPFFILLMLASLLFLARFIDGNRRGHFLISLCLAGLAFLTRYAGGTVVFAGMIVIFCLSQRSIKDRLKYSIIYGFLSSLPMAAWLVRNLLEADNAVNRPMAVHLVTIGKIKHLFVTVADWFLPLHTDKLIKGTFAVFLIAVLVALYSYLLRSVSRARLKDFLLPRSFHVLGIFICAYLFFLYVVMSLGDAEVQFDYRLMVPTVIPFLILLVCLFYYSMRYLSNGRIEKLAIGILIALVAATQLIHMIDWVWHGQIFYGFAGEKYRKSQILLFINDLPQEIPVYSNGNDLIYFYTGRIGPMLPTKVGRASEKNNENYVSEIEIMKQRLESENGLVVYFKNITWRWNLPSADELMSSMCLKKVLDFVDGEIYQIAR